MLYKLKLDGSEAWKGYEELFTRETRTIINKEKLVVKEGTHRVIVENQSEELAHRLYDVNTSIIKKDDLVKRAIFTIEDRSDVEELEKGISEINGFIKTDKLGAAVTHEVRNTLFSIKGYAQLFQSSLDENDDRIKYLKILLNEIERLQRLTEAFLSLAKKNNNSKIELLNLNEVMTEVLNLYEQRFKAQNIELWKKEDQSQYFIKGKRDLLKQVFINIIENALDVVGNKGQLQFCLYSEQGKVFIKVKDNGPGIREEDQSQVFNPFFTTKQNGTGLGLYICKTIVKEHGGDISFVSEEGKGTTFLVKLPLAET